MDHRMTCAEASDLAPAFALGALDRADEEELRAHLATCPHAHEELAHMREGVAVLLESVPRVEPPASLRARILDEAARDLAARPAAVIEPTRPGEPAPGSGWRGLLDALLGRSPAGWAMRAAAVLAIVALGAWNVALQGELAGSRSYQDRLEAVLALARQPGAQLALLAPASGGDGPHGVAVMPPSGEGRLVMTGLRPTTGSQVYEAWAIHEGEAPIPVGGFTVGADGVGYFDRMPAAGPGPVIVAITLEPGPNATAPSSDPVSLGVSAPVSTPTPA